MLTTTVTLLREPLRFTLNITVAALLAAYGALVMVASLISLNVRAPSPSNTLDFDMARVQAVPVLSALIELGIRRDLWLTSVLLLPLLLIWGWSALGDRRARYRAPVPRPTVLTIPSLRGFWHSLTATLLFFSVINMVLLFLGLLTPGWIAHSISWGTVGNTLLCWLAMSTLAFLSRSLVEVPRERRQVVEYVVLGLGSVVAVLGCLTMLSLLN
ncbi:hypothetical protein V3W47_08230 [Deinococcus sp. YIM 134068]|uniref:hypothetical protein n=1 Tax=Deinococcus lichenicola TaxID=3118910 RepID=UPI002F938BA6